MSSEVASAKSGVQPTNLQLMRSLLGGVVVLLCLFGAYESINAMTKLLKGGHPSGAINELFTYPIWSLVHFLPGLLFMTLTPFQLWQTFRNRHRRLHRWTGRVIVVCGLFLGSSGVTLPFSMLQRPFSEKVAMTALSAFFLFFLLKAFSAARRRDFTRHREWMIRWFAAGLGITTQRVLLPIFIVGVGIRDVHDFWEIFVTSLWLSGAIQIGIAQWWISASKSELL